MGCKKKGPLSAVEKEEREKMRKKTPSDILCRKRKQTSLRPTEQLGRVRFRLYRQENPDNTGYYVHNPTRVVIPHSEFRSLVVTKKPPRFKNEK